MPDLSPGAELNARTAPASLFVVLVAQDLAGRRIHKMGLLAGKACDRPVAFDLIRNVFGYKALDSIARVRAVI